jgi:hypothetical protein
MQNKSIGRLNVDWTLKKYQKATNGLSILPLQWIGIKREALGCQQRFLQFILLSRLLRVPTGGMLFEPLHAH